MNAPFAPKVLMVVCLAGIALPAFAGPADTTRHTGRTPRKAVVDNGAETEGPIQFAVIIVNGRKLSGPGSRARRRGGSLMIPVSAVARGLGDTAKIDISSRSLSVERQTGVVSDLDPRTSSVRE